MARYKLRQGDCLEVMQTIKDNGIDAIVCDPPYGYSFMGREWDYGVPGVKFWKEALRVAKPGAHLLAFGGTRTHHRLMVAIEDAGWVLRDVVTWMYGSGMPKGKNVLKPAWEPVILARKSLEGTVVSNLEKWGTGAINVGDCKIAYQDESDKAGATPQGKVTSKEIAAIGAEPDAGRNLRRVEFARPEQNGRWPANLIHDGSDEVVELFPYSESVRSRRGNGIGTGYHGSNAEYDTVRGFNDSGSAARFFYCSKASKSDRGEGNNHTTVKPTSLMRYLCKLITPPNGIVLDPFMGSGSTGKAALLEGFLFYGIELDEHYFEIASKRIREANANSDS